MLPLVKLKYDIFFGKKLDTLCRKVNVLKFTVVRFSRAKNIKTDYGEKIPTNSFVLEPLFKEVSMKKEMPFLCAVEILSEVLIQTLTFFALRNTLVHNAPLSHPPEFNG